MNININDDEIKAAITAVKASFTGGEKFAHVITLGCQQNEADSEKIRGMALMMGYEITDEPEKADLIVVNTCAVRQHAELKAFSVIGNFKACKTQNPETVVAVVGCMAAEPHVAEKIKKSYPFVSFTLEPGMIYKFPELLLRAIREKKRSFLFDSDEGNIVEGIVPVRTSKHRAWVSVMYGCNNFCSYCIVPYVRGRERSRDSAVVIAECEALISAGYREITLLGQNVNSYMSDMDFAGLLECVAKIPGDFVLRFMTSHPKDVSDKLIEVVGRYTGKIAPSFHLPLQSGSDRILKQMNRTYTAEKFLDTVKKLRSTVPGISITSDIIVGFPGETEEDFQDTLNMLSAVRFDMVYSFIFSPREGTKAAKMENQIEYSVKSERMSRLLVLQDNIAHENNGAYVGTTQKVLVDSVSKRGEFDVYSARTLTNKLVHFQSDENHIGKFIDVKITRAGAYDLYAERI